MASTGEVASFGRTMEEAYWPALASTNGFKPPKLGSGVMLGGDVNKPELMTVAKKLSELGFKLYCSDTAVEEALNVNPNVKVERINIPLRDKRKLREVFDEYDIQSVINLAKSRGASQVDVDYVQRRNAVDFGIPLINNARLAVLYVKALELKAKRGELGGYKGEGRIPAEVKAWSEWHGGQHN